jgi:hypothetical protein
MTKLVQVRQWLHENRIVTELAKKLSTSMAIENLSSAQTSPPPVYYSEPDKSIRYRFTSFP